MATWLIVAVFLFPSASVRVGPLDGVPPEPAAKMPPWLVLVSEMMPIEGLRLGAVPQGDTIARQIQEARADLEKKRPQIETYLTPRVVRSLSRWAQPQMKGYLKVPSLARVAWKPAGCAEKGRLVLEGTVDTLPTHHALVTRWLKVYLVYDGKNQEVVRVTVTIRGERLE